MFCKHCGKSIPDDSVFCPHCGGKLNEQSTPSSYSSINTSVSKPQSNNQKVNDVHYYEDEAGFLGVLLSIISPLIGIIMYFVTRKTRQNANYYLIAAIISAVVFGMIRAAMRH